MMMENDEARIRNHSHSIYSLFATKLHQAQKIGNYIKGYIDGKDCLDQFLKEYCDASNTKYIVRSSNKKSREFHFSKRNISDEDGANGTRYGHTGMFCDQVSFLVVLTITVNEINDLKKKQFPKIPSADLIYTVIGD